VNGPPEVHFLFEQQQKRLGGSMMASVVSHGAFVLLILLIMRLAPKPDGHAMLLNRAPSEIVWLAEPGAGGGGGGGGNQQKEPIKKAELPGKEKITVPVQKPPEPIPLPEVKPPEEQKVNIPAVTMSAENETSPGLIESKENTTSQGTGTQGGAGTGQGTGIGNGQGSGLGKEAAVERAAGSTVRATASIRRVCFAAFVRTTPPKRCAPKCRASSDSRASCCRMEPSAT
jgi:protein TonB